MKFLKLILILNLFSAELSGKPRFVFLQFEFQKAQYINMVKIIRYTDSTIEMWAVKEREIVTAKIPYKPEAEGFAFLSNTIIYQSGWPREGQYVLAVIGENGWISLFASAWNNYFRFWSPLRTATGSASRFMVGFPGRPVDNKDFRVYNRLFSCWYGCYYPIRQTPRRYIKRPASNEPFSPYGNY